MKKKAKEAAGAEVLQLSVFGAQRAPARKPASANENLGQGLAGCQTLEGSFSAVWTATIATKGSFCRDFQDLQDSQTFAPLRTQKFS